MARDPNLDRLINYLSSPPQEQAAPAKPAGVGVSDFGKLIGGGAVQATGYGVRGAAEPIQAPVRTGQISSRDALVNAEPVIEAGNRIAARGDKLVESISPAAKQAMQDSTPEGELLHPSTWSLGKNPSLTGYALQASNVIGQVAPVLATAAFTKGRVLPTVGVAASLGGGAAGSQEEQRIDQMPQLELDKVLGYQKLIAQGADPATARKMLSERSSSRSALTTMPVSALSAFTLGLPITAVGQKALGKIVGTSRLARATTGTLLESAGEGLQEASEQVAQTYGANQATGEQRSLGEGTFQNAVLGAIGAGPLGAVGALAHGPDHGSTTHPDETGGLPPSPPSGVEPSPATGAPQPGAAPDPGTGTDGEPAAPVPVQQTPVFTASQNPATQEMEVAPGVVLHADDGVLSKAVVEGAKAGAMDTPDSTTLSDGSVVNTQTGEVLQQAADSAETGKAAPGTSPSADLGSAKGFNPDAAAPDAGTTASIPFMITAQMRRDLTARGVSRQQIAKMTPAEAQTMLAEPVPAQAELNEPSGQTGQLPSNDELDAIVSGYYDTYGVIDAQTTGAIARRFGVQRQAVADAKKRVAQALADQRAIAPNQAELAPTQQQENDHDVQKEGSTQEVGQAGTQGTGQEVSAGQQEGSTQEVGGIAAGAAAGRAGNHSGHAAGADSQAGRGGGNAAAGEVLVGEAPARAAEVQPVGQSADHPAQVQLSDGGHAQDSTESTVAAPGPAVSKPAPVSANELAQVSSDAAGQPVSAGHAAVQPAVGHSDGAVGHSDGAVGHSDGGVSTGLAPATPGNLTNTKWFGTQDKADAYVAKQKLSDTHEVVPDGRRFEVRPKAVEGSAIAKTQTAIAEPAPAPEYTATLPGKQKQGVPAAELHVQFNSDDNTYSVSTGHNTGAQGHGFPANGHYATPEEAREAGLQAIERQVPKTARNIAEAGQIKNIKEWVAAERAKLTTPSDDTAKVLEQWKRDQAAAGRPATTEQIAARREQLEKPAKAVTVRKAGEGAHAIVIDPSAMPGRKEKIQSVLDRGGKVVGDELRNANGMAMTKLTEEEKSAIPANRHDTSEAIASRVTNEKAVPVTEKPKAGKLDLKTGDRIQLSREHEYAKANTPYIVENVGKDVDIRNEATGGRTSLNRAILESAHRGNPLVSVEARTPSGRVAQWVKDRLNDGDKITPMALSKVANEAFGGTQADGTYSIKDAYDAMELGVNQWILAHPELSPTVDAATAAKTITTLQAKMTELLPTQTKRTAEMDEFQQFSTHPAFAFLAAWSANMTKKDSVLEPSAGVGGLAVFAKLAGADVTVNELSARRAAVLKQLGFDKVSTENAEQLNNILPDTIKPSVVLMNPPFSSTAGRVTGERKSINGGKHIEQALARLEPGGRLVAIVGEGMADDKPGFKKWWDGIKAKYTVLANVGLPGKEYVKYGTTFDNNLLVIDKTGPTTTAPITGRVDTVADAIPLLENIHERQGTVTTQTAERTAGQQESAPNPDQRESIGTAGQSASAEPAVVGTGQRENGRGVSGEGAGSARPSERAGAVGEGAAGVRNADRNARGGSANQSVEPERANAGSGGAETDAGSGESGRIVVNERKAGASQRDTGAINADSTFENYTPQRVEFPGSKPHPGKLVQSAAMSAVEPPAPNYAPNLPKATITEGKLSDAQLESLVYAGQAHAQLLADGSRRGMFLGDGTGVGKGREIGGIILDNLRQGRKKAIWISEKSGLLDDAKRDYSGVGGDPKHVFLQGKTKASDAIDAPHGVLFTTYATLRSGESKSRQEGQAAPKTRMDQIVDWLGKDFDGVIAFDEAHNMGNAIAMKGKRGKSDPSSQALAGVELQKRLPNARIVYVSATGATEVSNLSYATRLGLWGPNTAFPTVESFISAIHSGGLAAMELVSRDMKQMGAYLARSLSFDGVTYSRIEHPLTDYQTDVYNELAKSWQVVLRNVHEALALTGVVSDGATNGRAKEAALSAFWGTQQRFFNQVLTAMQMPSVLEQADKDVAANKSVVMQLVNTNEAALNRALASLGDDANLEDLDLTPRDTLMQYVRNSYPVQQFESYLDEQGNLQSRAVLDAAGEPVFNKEAIAARDQLLQNLEHIRVPDGPLEMIIDHFGSENVAEITGRKNRVVSERNKDGNIERVQQKRSASNVKADADAFQAGKKHVLVFSDAGGTGYSFHADRTAKNQERRMHYLVQPGWRADKAVQGFGRTHRSNEVSEPHYYLTTTDLPAHKRFISTIARRLDQLGALTKGQRDASSSGLLTAKDNLESPYATDAVESLFRDMYNKKTPDLPFKETTWALGFDKLTDRDGALNETKIPSVPQFLNRLLSLPTDMQGSVFNAFVDRMEAKVQAAINNGTLDSGMETIKALSTKVLSEQPVYTDPASGAQTNYVELELTKPTIIQSFPTSDQVFSKYRYVQNKASGRIWAVKEAGSHTNKDGKIIDRVSMYSPTSARTQDKADISGEKFNNLTEAQAREMWKAEADKAPTTYTEKAHLITGALLPIWDRMKGHVSVARVLTDDGRRYLGRQINQHDLVPTLKALGANSSESRMEPADVQKTVMGGKPLELANGWVLEKKRVNNEDRMEVMRFPIYDNAMKRELTRVGGFMERIQWAERAFLPTGARGIEALTALTQRNPVVGPADGGTQSVDFSKAPAGTAAEQASVGVDAAELNKAVSAQAAKWKNAPVVRVVATANELPSYIRATAGFDNTVEAAHDRGAVYLIADRLASLARAQGVLAHEVIGHYGVEQILGKSGFAQVRDQIVAMRDAGKMKDLFAEIEQRYGVLDNDTLAAETLAVMAEKGMRNTLLGRFMAAMRAFLRGLGFTQDFNEGDLRQIITNAGKWLETGRAKPLVAVRPGANFSLDGSDRSNTSHEYGDIEYGKGINPSFPMMAPTPDGIVFGQSPYYINNASGESSASVEAQNRLKEEKGQGRVRVLLDRDGSARALYGVDAVDTVAGPGQIIVQNGVGKNEWSVVSRDSSMSRDVVAGKINAARLQLRAEAEELAGRTMAWRSNDPILPSAVFSKRPAADVANEVENAAKWRITDLVGFMRDKREDWRPGWLGLLTLRQLSEVAGKYLPRIQDYVDTVQTMQTRRLGLQEAAAAQTDDWWKWQRKNREPAKVMVSVMHDATLAGVDPAEEFQPGTVTLSNGEVVPMTAQAVTSAAADLETRADGAPPLVASILRADAQRLRETLGMEQSRREAYPDLKARYDQLPEEAKRIYAMVKKAYADRADAMQKALIERIAGLEISEADRKSLADRVRAHFESARVQGPYFPLARFGEYWVSAEKDGQKEFRMMENRGQQRRVQAKYDAAGWTTKAGAKIDMARAIDGASANFMAEVANTLSSNGVDKNVSDEIYQLYLRTLPDLSVRKQFIHRKGVAGYDVDALRAFAAHMNHGSYQLARLENTYKMEGILRNLRKDVKDLADEGGIDGVKASRVMSEVDKRHAWVMNPQDSATVQKLSAFNFIYYLGATPAAALVNLTQGAITTFPALASRHGWVGALKELTRAMQQSIRTYGHSEKVLTGDELRAHEELLAMGAIDRTRSHDLAGMGEGSMLSYSPAWRRTMGVISHGFHKAEVFNREAAGLAAYRLARQAGESHEAAVKYAADIIFETHFDYSNASRARFMQSNGAKVLFAFKQYSQHMTYLLWRNFYQSIKGATPQEKSEARRKLVGTLGMTAVFSGVLGLPLMTMSFAIANMFHAALGDPDEPWDAETEFRNFLVEMLGPVFGKIAQEGPVQALTGLGIANRTQLDQMWFRPSDRELEGRAQYDYLLEQVAGPLGGIAANGFRGTQLMQDGHFERGLETMLPKAVKDAMKAFRYADEGVNTLNGNPLVTDLSPYQMLMQGAGFSPAEVNDQYEKTNALKGYEKVITDRRKALMDAYAMGVRLKDTEMMQATLSKIATFNQKNPELAITSGTIRRSLIGHAKFDQRAVNGVVLNPKLEARLRASVTFGQDGE